ncbi:MAG: DNA repair protein RadC [Deltaproteobacteria bacterium]|nr:DNA repair protein RadC [Deltaproteobacteria bacterium]
MSPDPAERPRERLAVHGPEAMSADQLVAVVLGCGQAGESALELARRILAEVGGLSRLSRARAGELCALRGLGPARATRLEAAFALGRRALGAVSAHPTVAGAEDVYQLMQPLVAGLAHESFWVLALSVKNQVLERREIGRGSLTGVDVHPREVFRFLITARAAAGVVVHNHPSGDPNPSPEDLELTHRLRACGQLVGVPLVDHVIVAAHGFRSVMAVGES